MENWKISIRDVGYTDTREVYIYRRLGGGKVEFLRGDIIETIEDTGLAVKPSFRMSPEMLQAFADALSQNGINPKQGFLEGKVEATVKHLEDMRTLLKLNK